MDNIKQYIEKNINLDDICKNITDYTNCDSQYIDDIINEIADNNTDIYYGALIKWLEDDCYASDYIEQAVQEFGIDTQNFNFMRLIQQGQYQKNYEILYKSKYDMCLLWCLQYCLDNNIELTDEQIEKLSDIVDNHTEKFDDLIEKINEIKNDDD